LSGRFVLPLVDIRSFVTERALSACIPASIETPAAIDVHRNDSLLFKAKAAQPFINPAFPNFPAALRFDAFIP
jgi:hypothetical protein